MLLLSRCGVDRQIRRLNLERATFTLSKNVTRSQELGSLGGILQKDLAMACAGRGEVPSMLLSSSINKSAGRRT